MHRGWLAPCVLLLIGGAALSCGSRTAVLGDLGGGDSGLSGSGSGGGAGSGGSSGAGSGSSSGGAACHSGESLCAGLCVDQQTDPANCGGCGVVCDGTCALGRCMVTLVKETTATSLAVDATSVYWTTEGSTNGTVMSIPSQGGSQTVLASSQNTPSSVAVSGATVYWISYSSVMFNIMQVATSGGAMPVTLATGWSYPTLAVDGTTVYWSDDSVGEVQGPGSLKPATRVNSIPGGGGAVSTVVVAPDIHTPQSIAVDATNVYLSLTVSPGTVLQSFPLGGGAAVTLAMVGFDSNGIAAVPLPAVKGQNARDLYWSAGKLWRVPVSGGPLTTIAPLSNSVAVDATTVYWSTDNAVMSLSMSGGTPVTLANVGAGGIAVDATSVYWIGPSSGQPSFTSAILKLTPK